MQLPAPLSARLARHDHLAAAGVRRVRCAATDEDASATETSPSVVAARTTPGLGEANVVFSCGVIWLVFLTDLSGLGPVLLSLGDNTALSLCVLQYAAFVAPVVAHSVSSSFDLPATFALRACEVRHVTAGLVGGASLWVLLAAATALHGGVDPLGAEASYRIVEASTTVWTAPPDAAGWASLMAFGAVGPAIAEEALFRGYLLTALRSRLGSIDALAVAAVLFACFHLSISQFAPMAVLGLACGWAAVTTGSLLPAIAVHASHNAVALAWGAAMAGGLVQPGPPGVIAVLAAALGAAMTATQFPRTLAMKASR